jgi:arabinofuranan 3-O-arabinosyltransferase
VVVVDNHSTDATQRIAHGLASVVIVAGPERSRQRNVGAAALDGPVVGFIDSDMTAPPSLVEEAVAAIDGGAGAVVVPEVTLGSGFWATVRAFERSFYVGRAVESARFFRRDVFDACGGFNEELDAGEDWDLTLRAKTLGSVTRVQSVIQHHEGRVRFMAHCRKKATYAAGLRKFVRLHGRDGLRTAFDRPYLRSPWKLMWPHPVLGLGVVALKVGEAVAVALALTQTARRGRLPMRNSDSSGKGKWAEKRSGAPTNASEGGVE